MTTSKELHSLLQQYWGYPSFREKQEEIITSAIDGTDVLALLPTGGGKSLCFQLPGLYLDGICLVISPLIALMKDQVAGLKSKGIKAASITSGMNFRQIDYTLENCIHGDVKFLYVSPERLKSDLFIERFKSMKVGLIAVDEAHCISQWGYDFRPSYLDIAEIRDIHPETPVMALTATATPQVVEDIQEKLRFAKPHVIQKSFKRDNLAYIVQWEENKKSRLLNIIRKVSGSGIVYARNRKLTEKLTKWLKTEGVTTDFYHAGLKPQERDKKQEDWINNKTQVIVATNAFGMGIDKPDVRYVVHMDIPDNPEAYFQEAGRAGRDGKKAYAVSLLQESDVEKFKERANGQYPEPAVVKRVYQALCNYLKVANFGGEGISKEIDLERFNRNFNLDSSETRASLRVLTEEGLIELSESVFRPATIQLLLSKSELYHFQIKHKASNRIIDTLLRSYTHMFDYPVNIDEKKIAQRAGTSVSRCLSTLQHLHQHDVLEYQPMSDLPWVKILQPRIPDENFKLSKERYFFLKERQTERSDAMLRFINETKACRTNKLLAYLGEKGTKRCGICDTCIDYNKSRKLENDINTIVNLLKKEPKGYQQQEILDSLKSRGKNRILKALEHMKSEELIDRSSDGTVKIVQKQKK